MNRIVYSASLLCAISALVTFGCSGLGGDEVLSEAQPLVRP